jgi:endonuclease/exonuclease/phosphatase family metal-dependent hydrolase
LLKYDMNPLQSSQLPSASASAEAIGAGSGTLRVATYNIHKGVRGMGPARRLEIHNLCMGVKALDADMVFLQEVRSMNRVEAKRFPGWPAAPQAEFLAPEGYGVAYRTNAITKHGEHGNALLSRWEIGEIGHHDVSEHRFEQRGLLHACVNWRGEQVHTIVAHFGLGHAGRVRQAERLGEFIAANVPDDAPLVVAGDFNDWGEKLDAFLNPCRMQRAVQPSGQRALTFPSRVPVFAMDRIYTRHFRCVSTYVPRGTTWARMSDHLPLVAELELA